MKMVSPVILQVKRVAVGNERTVAPYDFRQLRRSGGFRLHRGECLPARRQRGGMTPPCASGRTPHASTREYPSQLRHRSMCGMPPVRVDTVVTQILSPPSRGRNRCQDRLLLVHANRINRPAPAERRRLGDAIFLRGWGPRVYGEVVLRIDLGWEEPSTRCAAAQFHGFVSLLGCQSSV